MGAVLHATGTLPNSQPDAQPGRTHNPVHTPVHCSDLESSLEALHAFSDHTTLSGAQAVALLARGAKGGWALHAWANVALAKLHLSFGHAREGTAALLEAVRVAQGASDVERMAMGRRLARGGRDGPAAATAGLPRRRQGIYRWTRATVAEAPSLGSVRMRSYPLLASKCESPTLPTLSPSPPLAAGPAEPAPVGSSAGPAEPVPAEALAVAAALDRAHPTDAQLLSLCLRRANQMGRDEYV
ncbi:hypothetical protein T492DRAFT_842334 [Pavlovales sp. CCMP2436]|nr:hypothetical protein T492DRAFT_842334 [Pavlovales sp. CCMP2436]